MKHYKHFILEATAQNSSLYTDFNPSDFSRGLLMRTQHKLKKIIKRFYGKQPVILTLSYNQKFQTFTLQNADEFSYRLYCFKGFEASLIRFCQVLDFLLENPPNFSQEFPNLGAKIQQVFAMEICTWE